MISKTPVYQFMQKPFLAWLLTIGFANMTIAAEGPGDDKDLKYQCMSNDKPIFLLEINNTENAEYAVIVSDRDQSVLFSEKIEGKNISRSYQLDTKEPFLITGTTFKVTSLLTNETIAYKIRGMDMSVAKMVHHSR